MVGFDGEGCRKEFLELVELFVTTDERKECDLEERKAGLGFGGIDSQDAFIETSAVRAAGGIQLIAIIADEDKWGFKCFVVDSDEVRFETDECPPGCNDGRRPFAESRLELLSAAQRSRVEPDAGIIDKGRVVDLGNVDGSWRKRGETRERLIDILGNIEIFGEVIERAARKGNQGCLGVGDKPGDSADGTIAPR